MNAPVGDYEAWKSADHAPEKEFLEKLTATEGIMRVETQTYTCERM